MHRATPQRAAATTNVPQFDPQVVYQDYCRVLRRRWKLIAFVVIAAMSAALRSAVESAQADPGVHAIVVTGAGRAFCAGADLSALGAATEDGLRAIYDGFTRLFSWPTYGSAFSGAARN